MKKSIYILLIIIVILLLPQFFGLNRNCGPKKSNVVFWTLQMGTFSNYINNIINEFESQNPNIHIVWVDVPYSEGEKRTLAAILSNNPPDLVNLTPDFSILLAQRKALYIIPESYIKEYSPSITNVLKKDDGYFAFPFYVTSALTFYNKDLYEKSKITKVPATYDELYSLAQQTKKLTNSFVTMPTLTENDTFLKILNKYNINTPDTINSQKSIEIFNKYQYLYKNNLIPKESITQTHREALEKYMAGQIVFLPAGANFLNIIKENAPKVFSDTEVTNQLVGETGKYDFSLMNLVIPKRSKNTEASVKFALFLTNKKNQLELAKLTTILPANKEALNDEYFTSIDNNDIFSKARVISANQLNNIQPMVQASSNQKELLSLINNYVQQIVLEKGDTKTLLDNLCNSWRKLYKPQ